MDRYRIDAHKLAYHPGRVEKLLEAGTDWDKYRDLKPIYAEISTSGACNHRCTFCSVDYIGYKSIFLDRETLNNFFTSSKEIGLKSVMFAGDGEPLLNKEIIGIVNDAAKNNIKTAFTTNGVYLQNEFVDKALHNVSWVKISINAGTPEVYEKIHRTNKGDFEKVWKNVRHAISYQTHSLNSNSSTTIGAQTLLLPSNVLTLRELAKRCRDTGLAYLVLKPYVHNVYMEQEGYRDIDYTCKIYEETIDNLQSEFNCESFEVVARKNALLKLSTGESRYNTCWSTPALWFYISGNGDVYACGAHVGNENFLLGNIKNQSMKEIWKSDNRKNCLTFVQEKLDLDSCRRTCRMDEVNKYLWDLKDGRVDHVDFI